MRKQSYAGSVRSPSVNAGLIFHGSPLPSPAVSRYNCFSASAKRYKYLRRLVKFQQMDFEFAFWQTVNLFISPQKVYRNFQYRKQSKSQFARDDPAFLVLLGLWICVTSIAFTVVLNLHAIGFVKFLLYTLFVDCLAVSVVVTSITWFVMNKYFRKPQCRDEDVEWGYAFDVHLNAYFPSLIILHLVQLFFYHVFISQDWFISRMVGNLLWVISIGYYVYITFLGYSSLPILQNVKIILYVLPVLIVLYLLSLFAGFNVTQDIMPRANPANHVAEIRSYYAYHAPEHESSALLPTAEDEILLQTGGEPVVTMDHEASPKPCGRVKDKRSQRGGHLSKGRAPRDKRKLREKRRSTGVVHLQSTESTGCSTEGEAEHEGTETKRNTVLNEMMEKLSSIPVEEKPVPMPRQFTTRRTKSPSDLDADDEDTQDCDSLHPSDSVHCLQETVGMPFDEKVEDALHEGRTDTPTGDNTLELLERAREENRKLMAALAEKDRQLTAVKADRDALLQAVASLQAK